MFTPEEVEMRGIVNPIRVLLIVLARATPALAQTVRIAVGAASVAHLPGRMAVKGGYFSREAMAMGEVARV